MKGYCSPPVITAGWLASMKQLSLLKQSCHEQKLLPIPGSCRGYPVNVLERFGCFRMNVHSVIKVVGPLLTQMNGTCLGNTRVVRIEDECGQGSACPPFIFSGLWLSELSWHHTSDPYLPLHCKVDFLVFPASLRYNWQTKLSYIYTINKMVIHCVYCERILSINLTFLLPQVYVFDCLFIGK